ncbi:ABC-type multidrug transport system ATPase subunit [Arthrobacter sp. JUb119]|uniref:ATP-binding cassette domain-containing protein n=2 Tax=Micrococcales TaxID=85006 RepID=UPI0015E2F3E6|nr:ABC transporter ATP-binding protein [Arthrobacter sp. MYb222]MCS3493844.1 ABC-type multidrug transport system ATPase subunit [Arthrobacter sp. JUb119]
MFSLKNISVRYGENLAIDDVTAAFEPGDFIGIFGHNGSGKSTLLKVISGLERSTSGSILVNQQEMSQNILKSHAVFIQDSPALYDYLSIRENVGFACSIWGEDVSETLNRLLLFGVQSDFETLVKNLSLGTRKKMGYVLSTLKKGPLFILDEPFNGLDAETVKLVARDLRLAKERGRTVVMTAHDPSPILDLLDRQIVLESGRVLDDVPRPFNGPLSTAEFQAK